MSMKVIIAFFFFSIVAAGAREPEFTGILYNEPERYLEWPSNLGDKTAIRKLAAKFKHKSSENTVRFILQWMEQHLRLDGKKAYAWRNFDDVIREKAYGSCADQAIICGVLLKAAGVPTIWVKTMDVPWIWDFKNGRDFKSWSGHVFLEVYVDGQWSLLDPGSQTLYTNYHPEVQLLPGNRFAYDKGNDPKEMIMSLQWEDWKDQTRAYFSSLDETLLPIDPKHAVALQPTAYVAANSPYYQVMTKLAQEAGFRVPRSFNNNFDHYLDEAKGSVLLVETNAGVPIIPPTILEKYFPGANAVIGDTGGTIKIGETTIVFLDISAKLKPMLEGIGK